MGTKTTAVALSALLFAHGVSVHAAEVGKVWRLGFLTGGGNRFSFESFRQGLRDFNYVEGSNITIEYLSAEGNQTRMPALVAELIQHKVDIIVTTSPGVRAAKEATKTTPIVMVTQEDPVSTGLVDSLAHPGGNLTGVTSLSRDLGSKRLELLRDVVPKILRVGVLWDSTDRTSAALGFKEYQAAALGLKMQLQSIEVSGPNPDLEGSFRAAAKWKITGLITIRNFLLNRYQKQIADLAIRNRLPSMSERSDYVEAGGLVSYSSNDAENYRRAAYFVDRIVKGSKPGDLPVEQPTKFELVVNLKTAKQIGLMFPPEVLARASRLVK